eukprot:764930-Hanusia_phi.AAC.2
MVSCAAIELQALWRRRLLVCVAIGGTEGVRILILSLRTFLLELASIERNLDILAFYSHLAGTS